MTVPLKKLKFHLHSRVIDYQVLVWFENTFMNRHQYTKDADNTHLQIGHIIIYVVGLSCDLLSRVMGRIIYIWHHEKLQGSFAGFPRRQQQQRQVYLICIWSSLYGIQRACGRYGFYFIDLFMYHLSIMLKDFICLLIKKCVNLLRFFLVVESRWLCLIN